MRIVRAHLATQFKTVETYYRAALESSSYLKMGRVMSWFLGNIGYHHVHHLNRLIPFYRLPEAMAAIPELQHPTVTSLHPHDILACLRLNLWDEHAARMVSYHEVDNSLMSIPPGEDIGREVHKGVDQVLVFVKGKEPADLGGETHGGTSLIHLVLVLAVIVLIYNLVIGRRTV